MENNSPQKNIDWMITLVPLGLVVALCVVFFSMPEQSNAVLGQIRFFFGDTFGTYYLIIGLGIFLLSLFIAGSKYGDIVLGDPQEKPQYSFFAWGSMMFTCGLAADFIAQYGQTGDLYGLIVSVIRSMPCAPLVMAVVLVTMVAFYATSFDSIALTASCYSYRKLEEGGQLHKLIQLMWCILLILLPIALLFAESSMNSLQSVSIVAAFPIGAVSVLIAVSFMKDAREYMDEEKNAESERGD